MKDNIKNLIVDFGGILVGLDKSRCISSFKELGILNIDRMIDMFFQEGIFGKHEKGLVTDSEFRNAIRSESDLPLSDIQIDNAWCSFLTYVPQYKLDFLKETKRNKKVFLLSNTNNIHWQFALNNIFNRPGYTVNELFDNVYLSYELNMVKPDSEIFEFVLKDAGINAEETLFIDDSEINCKVAGQLGIKYYNAPASENWTDKI